MSSDEEKEKQRREEERRRRDEEAEKVRQQVREKYEESARLAREASQRGADIAKRASEEGAKLGEEQARKAYEDAQSKLPPQIKPTYLHLISAPTDSSGRGSSTAQQGSALPLTTIASPPPRVYYVIVGCGTAAVVNHTTLRQTKWGMKERIGDFPVMHIGFDDPWSHYISHGMGQPPYLLTMPGFHQRPSQDSDVFARNPGCNSERFAACTRNEWHELWRKYHYESEKLTKFAWKEAFLVWIESAAIHPAKSDIKAKLKDEGLDLDVEKVKADNKLVLKLDENYVQTIPDAHYRLLIVVPQDETKVLLEYVYATKIDICTGPGRPRIPDGADWKEGRTKLWTPPRMWGDLTTKRKFVNGPEAFYTETIWRTTDRIYINGGGGIGLNMAERAEIVGCFADWAPTGTLHATFNLPRNDIVLKSTTGDQVKPGASGVRVLPFMAPTNNKVVLTPFFPKWRFGGGSEPSIVEVKADTVIIKIAGAKNRNNASAPPATPFIRDSYGENQGVNGQGAFPLSRPYGAAFPELGGLNESAGAVYHRICLTTGIVMDREMGTSEMFAKPFMFDALPAPGDGRTVGLQADGGRIRILGAAAQAHPSNKFKIAKPGQVEPEHDPASTFFFSLPMSAVVPGFIFSGINIALANHYFDYLQPNNNVNTMSVEELKNWIWEEEMGLRESEEEMAEALANAIIKRRRLGNGFGTPDDIAQAVKDDELLKLNPRLEAILAKLKTNYSPARDFLD